jgi:hypothetical protein
MARFITCGFELNSLTTGMEACGFQSLGGPPSISSAVKRTGTYAFKITVNGNTASGFWASGATLSGNTFFRCYLYIDTVLNGSHAVAASNGVRLYLNADNTLDIYNENDNTLVQAGIATLVAASWENCIEISAHGTSGAAVVRVNGVQVYSGTVIALQSSPNIGSSSGGESATSGVLYFDDIGFNDATGTKQNTWCGEGSVCYLRPNGEGDTDTGTPVRAGADSGAMWSQLDEETPNDATDYVNLQAAGDEVLVDVDSPYPKGMSPTDSVTLVEVHGRISAASATASNWFPRIMSQSGGSKLAGSTVAWASASWFTNDDTAGSQQAKLVSYTDPQAGGSWTPALLEQMQIAADTSDGNPDTYVSALWAIVEYVPAAPDNIYRRMTPTHRMDAASF